MYWGNAMKFKLPDFGKSSTVSNEFVTDPDVLVICYNYGDDDKEKMFLHIKIMN